MRKILFSIFALAFVLMLITIGGVAEEKFINVENIQITPPGPDVSEETANFSGAWEGKIWDTGGHGSQPLRLYVQEISREKAHITCAFGRSRGWRDPELPETWTKDCRVEKRKLVVKTPHGNDMEFKINKKGTKIKVSATVYPSGGSTVHLVGKMKRL